MSFAVPGMVRPSVLEAAIARSLADFPNDLARLIYLATLRDYNTGTYLHPELSRLHPAELVTQSLKLQHEEVFANLLGLSLRSYVDELRLYIGYSGVGCHELIATWKDLAAYRSAIPLETDAVAAELFNLNIYSALMILERMEGLLSG